MSMKRTTQRTGSSRRRGPAPKRGARGRAGRSRTTTTGRRWSHKVKSVSTFPPEETFTKDAETVARVMASTRVSPKGIGSAIRMVQFFINRAGKTLPAARRRELERAKRLLQQRRAREASRGKAA